MIEKGSGRIVWFVATKVIEVKIPDAILINGSEIKFDCPGYSVLLKEGRNGRWSGTATPTGGVPSFNVSCNFYRQNSGIALVGINSTDWIENGDEWQWVAELTVSKFASAEGNSTH